jgi:hypothetical protein
MRRILLVSVFIAGCGDSLGVEKAAVPDVECTFPFGVEPACSYKDGEHDIRVVLKTKRLAEDEVALIQAHVVFDGKPHALRLSPDVSMMAGSIGIVSFADINFDNIPDIAVSTSFGIANQYFDYWTYDPTGKSYNATGNYPKLTAHRVSKTLRATVKLDAAHYEQRKYSWKDGKLTRE